VNFARAFIDELRADPKLAADFRELLGATATPEISEPIYLRVADYAKRVSLSERTVWNFIVQGLPTIGTGRTRRVAVADADAWLRDRRETVDDGVERQARAAARRAAR
jgi:hypothetical protein